MADFAIRALCLVKNEADIIAHSLSEARRWADYIYVFDNGSTDNTWEKVLAIGDDHIIPWKREDKPFQESLRAELFQAFRSTARDGDWWCQLDADEFYNIQSPRTFLAELPPHVQAVSSIYVQYYITSEDLAEIDFARPVEQVLPRLRHYRADHCEPKFFRHRDRLVWDVNQGRPRHMGVMARRQILLRHYQYRSPQQIQRRLDTRLQARQRGFPGWGWEHATENWEDKIAQPNAGLHCDNGNGNCIVEPGIATRHLEPLPRRLLKRVMHGLKIWP